MQLPRLAGACIITAPRAFIITIMIIAHDVLTCYIPLSSTYSPHVARCGTSVTVFQVGPPGHFTHISITTSIGPVALWPRPLIRGCLFLCGCKPGFPALVLFPPLINLNEILVPQHQHPLYSEVVWCPPAALALRTVHRYTMPIVIYCTCVICIYVRICVCMAVL